MRKTVTLGTLAAIALAGTALFQGGRAETAAIAPAPAMAGATPEGPQTLVLAGGCFWGVQAVFQHVKGVTLAQSGYTGGTTPAPSYEAVSGGDTGHAESVKIEYDPKIVSTGQLLRIFFSVATDPTTLNAQGPDEGTQYRSDIFAATPEQAAVAKAYITQLEGSHAFGRPIVTRVDTLGSFTTAEAYHQDFALRHPHHPYIVVNDAPKVESLKRLFPAFYRAKPEGLAAASL